MGPRRKRLSLISHYLLKMYFRQTELTLPLGDEIYHGQPQPHPSSTRRSIKEFTTMMRMIRYESSMAMAMMRSGRSVSMRLNLECKYPFRLMDHVTGTDANSWLEIQPPAVEGNMQGKGTCSTLSSRPCNRSGRKIDTERLCAS